MQKKAVFVSYSSEDEAIAFAIRDRIKAAFGEACEPFVSARDISLASKWRERLQSQLQESALVLVICSPASVESAWVLFEAGGAWGRDLPLIPVLVSGLSYGTLPNPLHEFQHIDLVDEKAIGRLFKEIGGHLQASVPGSFDHHANEEEILSIIKRTRSQGDFDLFLSVPMSALSGKWGLNAREGLFEHWRKVRNGLDPILKALEQTPGLSNYFFAGKEWKEYDIGQDSDNAKKSFEALSRSRRFMMLYPEKVGSGCLVEAGFALARGIPSLYWHKENTSDLPFLLKNVGYVRGRAYPQPYSTFEHIAKSIQTKGLDLFPR